MFAPALTFGLLENTRTCSRSQGHFNVFFFHLFSVTARITNLSLLISSVLFSFSSIHFSSSTLLLLFIMEGNLFYLSRHFWLCSISAEMIHPHSGSGITCDPNRRLSTLPTISLFNTGSKINTEPLNEMWKRQDRFTPVK